MGNQKSKCQDCRRLFSHVSNLSMHVKIHGERPQCKACGESLSHLRGHLGVQGKAKPFTCSNCGKNFAYRIDLTRHARTHTGEKPFQCTECPKKFRQNITLQNHLRMHGKLPQLRCECCSRLFSDTSNLRKHRVARGAVAVGKGKGKMNVKKTTDRSLIKSSDLPGPSGVLPTSVRKLNRTNFKQTSVISNSFESGQGSGNAMGDSFDNLNIEFLEEQANLSTPKKSVFKCTLCPKEFQARTPLIDHFGEHAFEQ